MAISIRKKYKFTVVAVDVVIFTIRYGKFQVLLIKMEKRSYQNYWAIPGGMVKTKESTNDAAERILKEKTGIKNIYLEQLYTFGKIDRDPFGRVVSVAYFALVPSDNLILKTTDEYGDIRWFSVGNMPKLAYDHRTITNFAVKRLRNKLGYSNIIYELLPKEFTLSEMQEAYEIILARKLDKRNFRKKIFSLNLVKPLEKEKKGMANRPAVLYSFTKRKLQMVDIL